ncbi:hypothetical protein SAMN04515647_1014 [Cohaesibacter sp. ES.047]|uniref:hypothetical protein n=1 Tax=Cohaesibacter sp. ES.047 TaxID=1798205 RepID=UPI000BBFFD8D|nr:hypothetical protein [Cohaesibacter sp. ES.047]SNY90840.1 hypothetical protein SAMN04515647_1014 [Cohaesibacter sp. ES.047]
MTFQDLTSGPCALPKAPISMPTQTLERLPGQTREQSRAPKRLLLLRWLRLGSRRLSRDPA